MRRGRPARPGPGALVCSKMEISGISWVDLPINRARLYIVINAFDRAGLTNYTMPEMTLNVAQPRWVGTPPGPP